MNDIFVVNFQAFDHKDLTAYISLMNAHWTKLQQHSFFHAARNLHFPCILLRAVSLSNNLKARSGGFEPPILTIKRVRETVDGKFENGKRPFLLSNMTELQLGIAIIKHESAAVICFAVLIKGAGRKESSINFGPRLRWKNCKKESFAYSHLSLPRYPQIFSFTDVHPIE